MRVSVVDRAALRDPRAWAFALALIPFALLSAREWGYHLDVNPADHLQYIAHAEALLDGRPYADTGYIFSESQRLFAPRAYPPGLPLLLAGAFSIFGASHAVAKAVTLACGLAFLVIAGLYFRRVAGWTLGVGVVLLLGLSPKYLEMSVGVMSDIPFSALVWLTLLLADREGEWTLRSSVLVTAAAGTAVLFRPHGLILLPALMIWGALNCPRRGWRVLLPAAAILLATVLGRIVVGPASLRAFPTVEVLWQYLSTPDFRYWLALLESHLYPFPNDFANDVMHLFTLALMVVGLGEFVWRRPRSLAVSFALLYAFALGALPGNTIRFSFPLYPLWVFGVLNGIRVATSPLAGRRSDRVVLGYAVALALIVTAKGLSEHRFPPRSEEPPFVELMDHLNRRVADGDQMRIAFFRPRWISAQVGPPSMPLLTHEDPDVHLAEWCRKGLTHVILGGWGYAHLATPKSRAAIERNPDAFRTEFENGVYEVVAIERDALECSSRP